MELDENPHQVCYTIREMQHDDCDDDRKPWISIGITMKRNANEIMLKYDPLGTFGAQILQTSN